MKNIAFIAALLAATPALAQAIIGVAPGRNANAVAPLVTVTANLSTAPATGAKLSVFSSQAGGRKAGTTVISGATVQFTPTAAFRPGELLTAVYTSGAGGPAQAWQFTGAATGGSSQLSLSSQVPMAFDYHSQEGLVRLADVDGDGDLDMLTMGNSNLPSFNELLVRLNDGQGNFTTGWSTTIRIAYAWTWRCQLEVADVDNDGDLDILCSGSSGYVYVYTNNGQGTFQLQSSVPGGISYRLVVGDVDADGDLDFVQTSVSPSSHVFITDYSLGLNDGAGTFTVSSPFAGTNVTGTIKGLRDLDNNGTLDALEEIQVANATVLATRFNNGKGTFGTSQLLTTAADSMASWVCTDFDNDSDLDFLLLVRGCASCSPKLKVLFNDGTGHFAARSILPVTGLMPGDQRLAIADLTGDGRPDLLVTGTGSSVSVLPNLGNGTFGQAKSFGGAPTPFTVYTAPDLALGDLNGDGAIDVAAPFYPSNSGKQFTAILLNANTTLATAAARSATPAQVWPNPASADKEVLHLALPTPLAAGELRLTTSLGQEVRRQFIAGSAAEVPLRGLAPGLYLLTVHSAGQLIITQRVAVE